MVRKYRKRTPRRKHIPSNQRRLAEALNWLRRVAQGPVYILPTQTWTQEERDKFIVRNHFIQIFHPEHDLDIARGILVRDLPTFLKAGYDYKRERTIHPPPLGGKDSRSREPGFPR